LSEITETKFDYAVGEQRYSGLLLKAAHAAPKAAVALLPDWRASMLAILSDSIAPWQSSTSMVMASVRTARIRLPRWCGD